MHFQSGFLNVVASGEFTLEEAKKSFLEMLDPVVRHKAEKILLDGRNVHGNPKHMERFYYGEFAATETHRIVVEHNIHLRFAYVIHEPLRDPARFAETVAVNRGAMLRVFETLQDATEWLNKER